MTAAALAPDRAQFRANLLYGAGNFVGSLAVGLAALYISRRIEGAGLVFLALLVGVAQYRLSIVLHDCVHMSLFDRRRANVVVGTISAAALWTSFTNFRAGHLAHHKYYRTDLDPSLPDYAIRPESRRELIWFILQPLVGAAVIIKVVQFLNVQRKPEHARVALPRQSVPLIEILAFGVVQVCLALAATEPGQWPWRYVLVWVVPNATIMLFLSRLRTLLEHGDGGLDDVAPPRCGRTTFSNWLEQNVLSPMNFNYHYWHHKYPGIPSSQLPNLQAWCAEQEQRIKRDDGGNRTSPSFWATLCELYALSERRERRSATVSLEPRV